MTAIVTVSTVRFSSAARPVGAASFAEPGGKVAGAGPPRGNVRLYVNVRRPLDQAVSYADHIDLGDHPDPDCETGSLGAYAC